MQASKVFFPLAGSWMTSRFASQDHRQPQRGPAAGVLLHKTACISSGTDLLQGSARKVREDLHPPDIVQRALVPADAVQQTPGI